ncbi:hypothetical protein V1509DRAFT_642414 [Lipomyces kononenkoae]
MLAQRIHDSLRLRKRGNLSVSTNQTMHLADNCASSSKLPSLCGETLKSTASVNDGEWIGKDIRIIKRRLGNGPSLSIDTNLAPNRVRSETPEPGPGSMSTRRRFSARYQRLVSFLRTSHERFTSLRDNKATPISSSIFTLPSGLESSDFLLLPKATTAPQHQYPTLEMLSRSPRSTRSGGQARRSYSQVPLKADKQKPEFSYTPYAFYKLLATPSTRLPCSEYLSIYVPLVTTLTARARQKVETKRRKRHTFGPYNGSKEHNQIIATCSSGTRVPTNISLYSDDENDGDAENGNPSVSCDENSSRRSGNGRIGSKCTSYSGFYNPPTLRFVGGCRTFGEYLRDFCAWITSHGNENDNAPGIREDEVEELLRTMCPPALLRSMALMEGRNEDYYNTGSSIKPPKYSWLGYSTNALRNRNDNGSGKRKRELAKGIGVSYTADRNYIWRKRAEVIFNPEMVLREEHEVPDHCSDVVDMGHLERNPAEQLDRLESFEETGMASETSLLFREFVDSIFGDSESNIDLAELGDHIPVVNVNVRELDGDDSSKHSKQDEATDDLLGTVFHDDVVVTPPTKFQAAINRMWNYSLKKHSRSV